MTRKNILWGGRFSTAPAVLMQTLNNSFDFDRVLYAVDIAGSHAYAQALAEAGILTVEEAQQIQAGLQMILEEFENNSFVVQMGDEDIHTAVERRLTELIGEVGGKLHTGRSRNDQIATDIRLWLREACQQVDELLKQMQHVLIGQAEQHLDTIIPGYTHFQPAQPITVAHWLMSFFWMFQRDRERLQETQRRVNISPLGSSALAGTPYPIDREALAESLNFAGVTLNSLDGVSDRDSIAEFLFTASLIGVHLSRLAEDVIIYSNPSLGFVILPDAYSTGSSIMPQKRNPDPMELARGKAGRLLGNLVGVLSTLKGLPSGYNKDLQEDKEPLFDTYATLMILLPVLSQMVAQLEFNEAKLHAAFDENMLATELADWLVLEKGIPFREAHHIIGQVVQTAEQQQVTLSLLTLADYQAISPLFDETLYQELDFDHAVRKRQSIGGTSPTAVAHQIEIAKKAAGL